MHTRKSILVFIVALLIAGLLGAGLTHLIDQRNTKLNYLGHNCLAAKSLIDRIDLLNKGEIAELKSSMEAELDVNAVIIGLFVDTTDSNSTQTARHGLKMISDHRSKSPYSSIDPSMKERVDLALSKAQ